MVETNLIDTSSKNLVSVVLEEMNVTTKKGIYGEITIKKDKLVTSYPLVSLFFLGLISNGNKKVSAS